MTVQEKGTAPLPSQPCCSEIKWQIFSKGSWSRTHSPHTTPRNIKDFACMPCFSLQTIYVCLRPLDVLAISGCRLCYCRSISIGNHPIFSLNLLFTLLLLSVALTKRFSVLCQGSSILLFLDLESYVQRFYKQLCSIQTGVLQWNRQTRQSLGAPTWEGLIDSQKPEHVTMLLFLIAMNKTQQWTHPQFVVVKQLLASVSEWFLGWVALVPPA